MKTDYRFRFMYAIGIIMVVLGHCGNGGITLLTEWFPATSFHMPLFVFCAGYFFKEKSTDNVIKFIVHKFKTLILPYYIWNIVYGMVVMFLENYGFTISYSCSLKTLFVWPIINGHQFMYNLGGWFVFPLFFVHVYNVLVFKLLNVLKIKNARYILLITGLAVGMYAAHLSNLGYNNDMYIVIVMRVMWILPFYRIGIVFQKWLESMDKIPDLAFFSIIGVVQLIIITVHGDAIRHTVLFCNFNTTNLFLPYLEALLAIFLWLRIGKVLLPVIQDSKLVDIVGSNTYSIMIHHMFVVKLVCTIFFLIYKFTPYCQDFSVAQYKSSAYYEYLPNGLWHWTFVYGIAGLVLPIVLQLGIDKTVKFIKNKFV